MSLTLHKYSFQSVINKYFQRKRFILIFDVILIHVFEIKKNFY